MNTSTEGNELPNWALYGLGGGFLIGFVGAFLSVWGAIIGSIIIILVAIASYAAQGKGGGPSSTMLPALHRELAKTHCGQCGAPMRSNMMFCPSCGAKQAPA